MQLSLRFDNKVDKISESLTGKLKSLKETCSDGSIVSSMFDTNGRIISRIEEEHGSVVRKEQWEYDHRGNETSYRHYEFDCDFTSTEERQAEYNEQNLLVYEFEGTITSERDIGNGRRYRYEHDSSGRLLKKVTLTLYGELIETEEISYHENGVRSTELTYSGEAHPVNFRIESYFDQNGLRIKHYSFFAEKDGSGMTETTTEISDQKFY